MCRVTTAFALIVAAASLCAAAPAGAESIDSQCCGPLSYHIQSDGTLVGVYPKQKGEIAGDMAADGSAMGVWIQPRSDHPCAQARGGTYAWGRFVFRNVGRSNMAGEWGYCDDVPNHPWGFN
jgi:hypothetical protein